MEDLFQSLQKGFKVIVLVGDGMADFPIETFGNRTPLEIARTPHMDLIAKQGMTGTARTIPRNLDPGSDVANLSILGFDPKHYYTGRGPLEALSMGIGLTEHEVAFRCNFVTVSHDVMADYSAGHISSRESKVLMEHLNFYFANKAIRFFPGVSYRNLAVVHENVLGEDKGHLICVPPHDIIGKPISLFLPKGKGSNFLREIMQEAQSALEKHEINQIRVDLGENPGNMIWLWGGGKTPILPQFKKQYNLSGVMISAVDLLKGIGAALGLKVLQVPGATGYYDTNYIGKAEYALDALKTFDFVFLHVEAPDEAGHNGDLQEKVKAIENFDDKVVGTILSGLKNYDHCRVLVVSDHLTPIQERTHTKDPVPFALWGSGIEADEVDTFSEIAVKNGAYKNIQGHKLMNLLIGKKKKKKKSEKEEEF
ncbi:cofactor-independent phosphoglycerate mutase [Chlamydiota bacterium]